MACQRKQNTGSCNCGQCPFSSETPHGYECVDIMSGEVNGSNVLFCEVGEGCLEKCPFAWQKGSGSKVELAARKWCDEIEQELLEYARESEAELLNNK